MTTENDWGSLIDDLDRMLYWKDDWDGEGAKAPHKPAVEAAQALAEIYDKAGMLPADFVVVNSRGDVTFEWSNGDAAMEVVVSRISKAK